MQHTAYDRNEDRRNAFVRTCNSVKSQPNASVEMAWLCRVIYRPNFSKLRPNDTSDLRLNSQFEVLKFGVQNLTISLTFHRHECQEYRLRKWPLSTVRSG